MTDGLNLEGGASRAYPPCGAGLWSLLISSNRQSAIRLVTINTKFRAEIAEVAATLTAVSRACDTEELAAILTEAAPGFGVEAPDGDWASLWAPYLPLAQLPALAILRGIEAWKADKPIFPRPVDVQKLATPFALELRSAAYRARLAAEEVAKAAPPKAHHMSRQEMIDAGYIDADGKAILRRPAAAPVDPSPQPLAEPGFAGQPFRPTGKPPEPPEELPDVSGEVF